MTKRAATNSGIEYNPLKEIPFNGKELSALLFLAVVAPVLLTVLFN